MQDQGKGFNGCRAKGRGLMDAGQGEGLNGHRAKGRGLMDAGQGEGFNGMIGRSKLKEVKQVNYRHLFFSGAFFCRGICVC